MLPDRRNASPHRLDPAPILERLRKKNWSHRTRTQTAPAALASGLKASSSSAAGLWVHPAADRGMPRPRHCAAPDDDFPTPAPLKGSSQTRDRFVWHGLVTAPTEVKALTIDPCEPSIVFLLVPRTRKKIADPQ